MVTGNASFSGNTEPYCGWNSARSGVRCQHVSAEMTAAIAPSRLPDLGQLFCSTGLDKYVDKSPVCISVQSTQKEVQRIFPASPLNFTYTEEEDVSL